MLAPINALLIPPSKRPAKNALTARDMRVGGWRLFSSMNLSVLGFFMILCFMRIFL
jgi:hypothetical protein